jgi:hypothetical protein
MTLKLSEYLERHGNGIVDIERSVNRLRDVVKRRVTFERVVGEVMAEVLSPLTKRINLMHLTGLVVMHRKMIGFETDFSEVPDIFRNHIAYTPDYTIVKGTYGGVFKEKT